MQVKYCMVGLLLQNFRHMWELDCHGMTREFFSNHKNTIAHKQKCFRTLKDFQTLFFLASCNYILSLKNIISVYKTHELSDPHTFLVLSEQTIFLQWKQRDITEGGIRISEICSGFSVFSFTEWQFLLFIFLKFATSVKSRFSKTMML